MIDAVSNVSFRGENSGADIINAPSKFSVQAPLPEAPVDSFERAGGEEKKSGKGLMAVIGTAIVALAAFAGLGYAVKKGHLEKVEVENVEGFFNKAWARIKNAGAYLGEKANSCYETVAGWFGREAKDAKPKEAPAASATPAETK